MHRPEVSPQPEGLTLYERLARYIVRKVFPPLGPKITRLKQHAARPLMLPATRPYAPREYAKITLVTPSFRGATYLERAILSVLDQEYPALEYVIVDGGSGDGTVDILKQYAPWLARWVSEPDEGLADALNKGFRCTSGEIMGYLNSDDMLLPGTLAAVEAYMRARPQVDAVYGHRILIDESDQEIGRWILPTHDPLVLKWVDWVPQETLFWRRSLWRKVGESMDTTFKFAVDWDLLLRFQEAGGVIERMNRFGGAFRVHPLQMTSARLADHGLPEMKALRRRSFGRDVADLEIRRAVRGYLLKHVLADAAWRLGLSDLES